MDHADVFAPAIELAENGTPSPSRMQNSWQAHTTISRKGPQRLSPHEVEPHIPARYCAKGFGKHISTGR